MPCFNFLPRNSCNEEDTKDNVEESKCTNDGTVDHYGKRAIRPQTGRWKPGTLLLVNQGLATMAFFGISVNLVLFLTRVQGESNEDAANNVSKWTGTVYLFALVGAFLSDSYWGRFFTCAVFQAIFALGLASMTLISHLVLLKPRGCGDEQTPCDSNSTLHKTLFNMSLYMVALGMGGYQPNIAIFGADQFDEKHLKERKSKDYYFSYIVLAINLGSLFSKTILGYIEDDGKWVIGFLVSTICAFMGLTLFVGGIPYYRHFIPSGNPFSKFFKVFYVAMCKHSNRVAPQEGESFHESSSNSYSVHGWQKIFRTQGLKFLDRASCITSIEDKSLYNQGKVCTIKEVEEVKCILRLIPIWLCTIFYSVVFAQMSSLFIEQGAAMKKTIGHVHISPTSLSIFNILSVAVFIFINRHVLNPIITRMRNQGLTELERMGIGLVIACCAMMAAGFVEVYRLKYATGYYKKYAKDLSSLSIMWQIPQYVLIGMSEVFMGVARLEFFYGQAPEGLKCFGNALCLTSVALGNYLSSLTTTIVMKISTRNGMNGWIPEDLNKGHLDRFYFLLAGLTIIDFVVYVFIAKSYEYVQSQAVNQGNYEDENQNRQGMNEV